MDQKSTAEFHPENLLAVIGKAYLEVLAGVRRPEQLARWLSDKAYYELRDKAHREARSRQVTGATTLPSIVVKQSKTFATVKDGYQGVLLVKISGATKAVSIRARNIHQRFRVTELEVL